MLTACCHYLLVYTVHESKDFWWWLSILFIVKSPATRTEYLELSAWHIMVVNKYLWQKGRKDGRKGGKQGRKDR